MNRRLSAVLALVVVGGLGWLGNERFQGLAKQPPRPATSRAVPVEVATIARGDIEQRRTFTGNLAPKAEFVVAPKIAGRIERLRVDLADTVGRDQLVAELDDDEYVQAVAQAEADRAVARANLVQAESLLSTATRDLERSEQLRDRGVTSESQLDAVRADKLAKQALVEVAKAQIARADATLEAARIRLGYTSVTAGWQGGSDERVVAERFVDEGQTVAANAPLLRIVEMHPVNAVFFVTERDYSLLRTDQLVTLHTDAYPGETFEGRIARIAPVFLQSTRQARVEVSVENADLRLKPGMFVRATVVLERVEDTTILPEQALVNRDGRDGVFVVMEDGRSVAWREVEVGFRQDGRVQVSGEGLGTRVVTLGQQLLDDGSPVSVSGRERVGSP